MSIPLTSTANNTFTVFGTEGFGVRKYDMELYPDDLAVLQEVMSKLDDIASIDGVMGVEIRVQLDGEDSWVVLGYGESGDPCILRFEKD